MHISQKIEADAIISRMRDALGAKSDIELGRKLGSKSRGYVANWRKEGKVPAKAIEKASQISERSFESIRYGDKLETPKIAQQVAEEIPDYITPLNQEERALLKHYRALPEKSRKAILGFIETLIEGQD